VKIRLIAEWTTEFGGEAHSGWLPAGAVEPGPTPVIRADLALVIMEDAPGSYVLEWRGPTQQTSGDRWYPSLEAAVADADTLFGIPAAAWAEAKAGPT